MRRSQHSPGNGITPKAWNRSTDFGMGCEHVKSRPSVGPGQYLRSVTLAGVDQEWAQQVPEPIHGAISAFFGCPTSSCAHLPKPRCGGSSSSFAALDEPLFPGVGFVSFLMLCPFGGCAPGERQHRETSKIGAPAGHGVWRELVPLESRRPDRVGRPIGNGTP